jgi:cation:H+ antiporter
MANDLGISPFIVALVVIGIGSSVSDASIGIRSVLKGHNEVGLGNVLGSNVTKSTFFLGVLALVNPITFAFSGLWIVLIFTFIVTGLTLHFMRRKFMLSRHGILMLILYGVFLAAQWLFG